jgi:hypothetical protein
MGGGSRAPLVPRPQLSQELAHGETTPRVMCEMLATLEGLEVEPAQE